MEQLTHDRHGPTSESRFKIGSSEAKVPQLDVMSLATMLQA